MKPKQLLACIIAVVGITSMVLLTGAAANKHMTLGWYIFGMAIFTLVLQVDAWYLESYIINGKWKEENSMAGAVKHMERSHSGMDKNYEYWRRHSPVSGGSISARRIRQALARIFGR